ncbi:MAG: hypothetical protein WDZ41_00310 [Candidatus Babeliales bacterium]
MKLLRKLLIFWFLIIFPLNLLTMEIDQNPILLQNIPSLNLKQIFGYNSQNPETYLRRLQFFASALLFQHKFILLFNEYTKDTIDQQSIELDYYNFLRSKSFVTIHDPYSSSSQYGFNILFNITSPEAINITMRYKPLFLDSFSKDVDNVSIAIHFQNKETIENNIREIEKGKYISLIEKWQQSTNEEVQFIGNFLAKTKNQNKKIGKANQSREAFSQLFNDHKKSFKSIINFINRQSLQNKSLFKSYFEAEKAFISWTNKILKEMDTTTFSDQWDTQDWNFHSKFKNIGENYYQYVLSIDELYKKIKKELSNIIFEYIKKDKIEGQKYKLYLNIPISIETAKKQQLPLELLTEIEKQNIIVQLNNLKEQNAIIETDSSPKNEITEIEKEQLTVKKNIAKKRKTKKKKKYIKQSNNIYDIENTIEQNESKNEIIAPSNIQIDPQINDDIEQIIEENNEHISINDPNNEIKILIFKTDQQNQPTINATNPNYTHWVKAWFENPQKTLFDQGYSDETSKKYTHPDFRKKTIITHAFSQLVDTCLTDWAKQSTTASRITKNKKDILLTLPGCIYYKNNQWETGLFTYIVDSQTGEWYHRNFVSRSGKELINEYFTKGFYEVEFPPLSTKAP